MKDLTLFALDTLLGYAKFLEDNNQLSYDLLKQRVDTYRNAPAAPVQGCTCPCHRNEQPRHCDNCEYGEFLADKKEDM